MVLKVSGKNAKLNAALRGAARGLPTGLALGQRSRSLDQDQERQRFYQDQVIRQAKLAADELEREEGYRRATGEAVAEAAKPVSSGASGPFGKGAPGVLGKVQRSANMASGDMAALDRVGKIAQKMDPRYALDFVRMMQEKHAKLVDKRERADLEGLIANDMAGSSLFTTQPDGSLMESKETSKAAESMIDALGKGAPVEQVRADRVNLKRQQAKDRTSRKHLTDTLAGFDQDIATSRATRSGGPGNESSIQAGILQSRTMQGLRDEYEQFSDELLRDPNSAEAQDFLSGFSKRWGMAKNGLVEIAGKPVPIEAASYAHQVEQSKVRIAELEAKIKERELADAPQKMANDTTRAEAAKLNATRPRGPASGTVNKPMSPKDAMEIARGILEKTGGDVSPARMQFVATQVLNADAEMRAGQGAQSASGESVGEDAETDIDPKAAAAAGWTSEEWDHYEDTGEMPEGKPIQ